MSVRCGKNFIHVNFAMYFAVRFFDCNIVFLFYLTLLVLYLCFKQRLFSIFHFCCHLLFLHLIKLLFNILLINKVCCST